MGEAQDGRHEAVLKHAATRALYAYWDRLRGGRPAPERQEIEPSDIGAILSDTFILEAVDDETYAYRLAGTRVCTAFGRELKGENWLDGWTMRDREALATLLRTIVGDGASAGIEFTGSDPRGRSVPFEVVMLPLVNRGRSFTRVLGATVALAKPYWLGAQPIVARSLTGLRLIWPNPSSPFGRETSRHPVFERALPLRRRRHLALYDGGRLD